MLESYGEETVMLADKDVMATIAVKDIEVASRFYEETLGLKRFATEGAEAVVYKSGMTTLFVYESRYAGTNRATAATWILGEGLDGVVQTLKEKGVTFEHYDDLPGTTRQGDVHVAGKVKLAWLKDPDGNILALASG
jgi:catechol 2,3-dioxygenase-like lactoylglutathione lyase family enzyme